MSSAAKAADRDFFGFELLRLVYLFCCDEHVMKIIDPLRHTHGIRPSQLGVRAGVGAACRKSYSPGQKRLYRLRATLKRNELGGQALFGKQPFILRDP